MTTKNNQETQYTLPKGWRWARLDEECLINPTRTPINRSDNTLTTFIPMTAVDDLTGNILAPETRPYEKVKKGYTYFTEGDVLFAKITPCMQNGKHAIARNLIDEIGFGSTEFHIIRPGSNIMAEWIHSFIRQPSILEAAATHFTGTVGQQRVPPDFLATLEIPLPPIPEQQRITGLLTNYIRSIAQALAAMEVQLEAAKALSNALLRRSFNGALGEKWKRIRLGTICDITMGQSPSGTSYNTNGNGFPLLNGPTEFGILHPTPIQWTTEPVRFAKVGDILLCVRGATTGRKNTADKPYCIGRGLAAIRGKPDEVTTDFLSLVLDLATFELLKETAGSTFPNLPGEKLANFEVLIPPLDAQQQIVSFIQEQMRYVDRAIQGLHEQIFNTSNLSAALLRRAFSGEL